MQTCGSQNQEHVWILTTQAALYIAKKKRVHFRLSPALDRTDARWVKEILIKKLKIMIKQLLPTQRWSVFWGNQVIFMSKTSAAFGLAG